MEHRRVGRTGLFVSRICFGSVAFGERLDEPDSLALIDRAVGEGVNFFDTANTYNAGRTEEILGKAIKGRRYETIVASKVGAGPFGLNIATLSRKHIMHEIEGTLRRLGTDYVDILYAHKPDPETPIDETMEAFGDLVRQGKVRYLGCSNFAAWEIAKAQWTADVRRLARFECIQPRYNLLERDIEAEVVPFCVDDDISIYPYGALAGGMLTGKYLAGREPVKGDKLDSGLNYRRLYWHELAQDFVERLKTASDAAGHTLTQTALAWLLEQPRLDATIVGMRNAEQLDGALSALQIELTDDEREVCAAGPAA
jgi:1-deoxyxylulose-5-phosphate synthase